jgi:hypothetical protein
MMHKKEVKRGIRERSRLKEEEKTCKTKPYACGWPKNYFNVKLFRKECMHDVGIL